MERLHHTHPDDTSELLSAFVDDAVDVIERRRAEAQIAQCTACAQEVRELRALKSLMRDVPLIQPKRSFTLDPATVTPRRQLFPIFRWATVVSSVLLFIVLGADLIGSPGSSSPTSSFQTQRSTGNTGAGSDTAQLAPMMERVAPAASAAAAASEAAASTAAQALEDQPQASAEASQAAEAAAGAMEAAESSADVAASEEAAALDAPSQDSAATEASAAPSFQPTITAAYESTDSGAAGGAAASPAFGGGGTTAAGGEQLEADPPAAANTTELAPAPTDTPALSTLQIAQIVLALAAAAFALATWWAWRRQL